MFFGGKIDIFGASVHSHRDVVFFLENILLFCKTAVNLRSVDHVHLHFFSKNEYFEKIQLLIVNLCKNVKKKALFYDLPLVIAIKKVWCKMIVFEIIKR